MSDHNAAVRLTPGSFAEVIPREYFADVTFQRCSDAGCGQPTMIVRAAAGPPYVFHLTSDELSAIEMGAGRFLAGLSG